jgi:hypothetical protein
MKPSLVLLTAVAILVAAVSASSRLSAAPSSSPAASPATKSSCGFASLPRAASVRETLYGHIKSLRRRGRRFVLRFDPAWLLTGVTATRAALEDTGSSDVPNDTYTRDETHRLLTYLVPANARVTVLTHATCSTRTTVAKVAKSVPPAGFWIAVRGDTVSTIDQQYHP